jgi:nucleoside-diphosphate kinase
MAIETTLVLIKPDGVRRQLAGQIISRFEAKGFVLAGAKLLQIDEELASRHYAEHVEKPFYPELRDFITSGPTMALAIKGEGAVAMVRKMMGATNPADSAPGTIRGDFATVLTENIVHGSDSPESAERELGIFFKSEEIVA